MAVLGKKKISGSLKTKISHELAFVFQQSAVDCSHQKDSIQETD